MLLKEGLAKISAQIGDHFSIRKAEGSADVRACSWYVGIDAGVGVRERRNDDH
jgi:hypothetical protein